MSGEKKRYFQEDLMNYVEDTETGAMDQRILGWHFVSEDKTLDHDSKEVTVAPGYVYIFDSPDKLALCTRGLHASRKAIDALTYAPGPII